MQQNKKEMTIRRYGKWFACVLCLAGLVAFFLHPLSGALWMHLQLSQNDGYHKALARVQEHPDVRRLLGSPITPRPLISGNIDTDSIPAVVQMAFVVSGPRADGNVYLQTSGTNDQWTLDFLAVEIPSAKRELHLISNSNLGDM